jgi:hypothetical protein
MTSERSDRIDTSFSDRRLASQAAALTCGRTQRSCEAPTSRHGQKYVSV